MGNPTVEIPWYIRRTRRLGMDRPDLDGLPVRLAVLAAPVRESKRPAADAGQISVWILIMHLVNDFWLVSPAYPGHERPSARSTGSTWRPPGRRPLGRRLRLAPQEQVAGPLNDPYMEGADGHGGH
ncbi:MAG: hypothetical protein WKF75_13140 [Singulisphaera sp.]